MQQKSLFDDIQMNRIINVATVPMRSPFRYPGGKTWLVPYLRKWLAVETRQLHALVPMNPAHFVEPFAGGGILSLTAVAEGLVKDATLVEIDADVASVWQTILDEHDWAWLTNKIASFDLSLANVQALLAQPYFTRKEQAFNTIVRNRVARGGILAPGAGFIKQGEKGKGIKSRWYPATLARRIRNIAMMREQFTFIAGDGMAVLRTATDRADTIFFIDPPYTFKGKKAGTRLYTHTELDHEALFEQVSNLHSDFIMTYDDVDEIRLLARRYGFDTHTVSMKNTHHAKATELLIGPNLSWLRDPTMERNM